MNTTTRDTGDYTAKLGDKTVGTKLHTETFEVLEKLATLSRATVSSLVRQAVLEFVDREQVNLYPFTLVDVVSLSTLLHISVGEIKTSTHNLIDNSLSNSASGVYMLIETSLNELYVGSTVGIKKRLTSHRSGIKTGKHKNLSLRRWDAEHTVAVVLQPVVNTIKLDELRAYEQTWIEKIKAALVGLAQLPFDLVNTREATLKDAVTHGDDSRTVVQTAPAKTVSTKPLERAGKGSTVLDTIIVEDTKQAMLDGILEALEAAHEMVLDSGDKERVWCELVIKLHNNGAYPSLRGELESHQPEWAWTLRGMMG